MGNDQGFLKPHQSKLDAFFRFSDVFLIAISLIAALWVTGKALDLKYELAMFMAIAIFSITAESQHLYLSFRGARLAQFITPIFRAWLITIAALLALAYGLKITEDYSRLALGVWFVVTPFVLLVWRLTIKTALSKFRSNEKNNRKVAIIGAEPMGVQLAEVIRNTPSLGLKMIGFYDDRQQKELSQDERVAKGVKDCLKGNIDDAVKLAESGEVDLIYIAFSLKGQQRILEVIQKLSNTSVRIHLVPDLFVFDLLHSRFINLGPIPTISIFESPYFGVDGWVKRAEDVLLSSVILALIAIPMLFIAAGVKLTSPGPVFFKQRRYGIDGSEIKIWKFRSMKTLDDGAQVKQATKNDTRITKFGAFLRKTSLDELPQFINVLRGEMSIVGPRPHAVAHNEEYRKIIDRYMLRHRVKPGITGWAQVNGWRGETDTVEKMEKRVEHDIYYIRNWSVWFDLMIILKTLLVGFVNKNAY